MVTAASDVRRRRELAESEGHILAVIERSMLRIMRRQSRRTLGSAAAARAERPVQIEHIPVLVAAEEKILDTGEVMVNDIAAIMGIDPSRASRLVNDAIKAGYLLRIASQQDGRRTCVELTPQGQGLVDQSHAFRQRLYADVLADWSDRDKATFARLLNRFTETLNSGQPGGRSNGAKPSN